MSKQFCSKIYETTSTSYSVSRKADPIIVNYLADQFTLDSSKSYLDVGCGTGNYTCALAQKGLQIQGVDLSPSMLEQARTQNPNIAWHRADMRELPFADHTFDGVCTIHTLHYVRNSMQEALAGIKRVIKSGGQFLIMMVALEQCLQLWVGHYFPFFWDLGYDILLREEQILSELKEAGFKNVETTPYYVTDRSEDLFISACKYRPQLILDPAVREGMTPLQRPEYKNEIEAGCAHLADDITSGKIKEVIAKHETEMGEALFISATVS